MTIKINSLLDLETATADSAGIDLRANEKVSIPPVGTGKHWKVIATGVTVELPQGVEAQVRSRSGLAAKYGVIILNSPGTIDSDYKGEIKVILANLGDESFDINKGDRIAQLVLNDIILPSTVKGVKVNIKKRNDKGFGSSGIK